jgi:hypothetical protein
MQLFITGEQRVLSEFKVALIYLEQWEVLDPKSKYKIPASGKIDSPGIDLTCKGSLGYIYDWFLRPVKDKNHLRHAFVTGKSDYTRRSSLQSLYRLEYSTEDIVDSISTDKFLSDTHSKSRDKDCWSNHVSGYLKRRSRERAKQSKELSDYVLCPTDQEVKGILLTAATYIA